jgi:hypothetical protein
MSRIRFIKVASLVALVWVGWWAVKTFSADERTQMLRVQEDFVTALEKRKWGKVDAWVSSDYSDDWGQGPNEAKDAMRQVLGGFIILGIEREVTNAVAAQGLGFVKTKLLVQGSGGGASAVVVAEAKRIKEPWVFHWHKRGFWPWSWELVQIANEDLRGYRLPDGPGL